MGVQEGIGGDECGMHGRGCRVAWVGVQGMGRKCRRAWVGLQEDTVGCYSAVPGRTWGCRRRYVGMCEDIGADGSGEHCGGCSWAWVGVQEGSCEDT